VAHLVEGERGPILVYGVEAADLAAVRAAIQTGALPIAREWRQLMSECSAGHPSHEVLFEHRGSRSSAA
jgi:hypothetical protein